MNVKGYRNSAIKILAGVILCLLHLPVALAQTSVLDVFSSAKERGDKLYKAGAYVEALEAYQASYAKDSSDFKVWQGILKCESKLSHKFKVLHWCEKLAAAGQILSREQHLAYADAQRACWELEKAADNYLRLLQEGTSEKALLQSRMAGLDSLPAYTSPYATFELTPLAKLNSPFDEVMPVYSEDGLVFLSNKPSTLGVKETMKGGLISHFYYSKAFVGESQQLEILDNKPQTGYSYFAGRDKAIVGRKVRGKDGLETSKLFLAEKVKGTWRLEQLPFCAAGANYIHPVLSQDNTYLFFASDIGGGYGKMDVYYIRYLEGKWTEPVNLGAKVNTEGDELFPFIAADYTLYFSSDGLPGIGGFDLFKADFEKDRVLNVQNMGAPVNSIDDDKALVWDSHNQLGFLSSNRNYGNGFDLFKLEVGRQMTYTLNGRAIFHQGKEYFPVFMDTVSVELTDVRNHSLVCKTKTDGRGYFSIVAPYTGRFQLTLTYQGEKHKKLIDFPVRASSDKQFYVVYYPFGKQLQHTDFFLDKKENIGSVRFWEKFHKKKHNPCEHNALLLSQGIIDLSIFEREQGTLDRAEKFYSKSAYEKALAISLNMVDEFPSVNEAKLLSAKSLFRLNRPYEAVYLFNEVICRDGILKPDDYKLTAEALVQTGSFDAAIFYYQKYLDEIKQDEMVQKVVAGLEQMSFYLKDSIRYTVKPVSVNSKEGEYASYKLDEELYFISDRKPVAGTGEKVMKSGVYKANAVAITDSLQFVNVRNIGAEGFEQMGPFTFTADKQNVFATVVAAGKKGKKVLQIHEFKVSKKNWKHTTGVNLNSDVYSIGHPALTHKADKMYFVSDMPGGFGGSDLYVSRKLESGWSQPENLGAEINTAGDEMFPYIKGDSILYFASDGHGGMGGLDIYSAEIVNGRYRNLINLGFPVNSPRDDFAYTVDNTGLSAYLSSNRKPEGDDDLYHVTIHKVYSYILSGSVLLHEQISETEDPERVKGVNLSLVDMLTQDTVARANTDWEGKFWLRAPYAGQFNLVAHSSRLGEYPTEVEIPMYRDYYEDYYIVFFNSNNEYFRKDFLLSKDERINKAYLRRALYKSKELPCFTYTGYVADTLYQPLDANIYVYDVDRDMMYVEASDAETGAYSFCLDPGTEYVFKVMKKGYLSTCFKVQTGNLTSEIIGDKVVLEKIPEMGKVMMTESLYYEVNGSDISPEIAIDLDKLVKFMKDNPTLKVELSSHTDSRGSAEYNRKLSELRAKKAVEYIVANGVHVDRISAIGYGEEQILNQCVDGIQCSEEDHSKNRRTEVKIMGEIPLEASGFKHSDIFNPEIDRTECMPVEKQLSEAVTVYIGSVEDAAGFTISEAKVHVYNPFEGSVEQLQTNHNGMFKVSLKPEMTYNLVIEKSGFWPQCTTIYTNSFSKQVEEKPFVMEATTLSDAELRFHNLTGDFVDYSSCEKINGLKDLSASADFRIEEINIEDIKAGYAIQLGAYQSDSYQNFEYLKDLGKVCRQKSVDEGIYRYFLLRFDRSNEAEKVLQEVIRRGVSDAFIYPLGFIFE
ncbi:OmpA family protein [Limibacter armeniacum]|uniref:OmpA family protein n=1 Tax=Limibacter armeniacum TaxID=466084 RepID=UPI002FE674E2